MLPLVSIRVLSYKCCEEPIEWKNTVVFTQIMFTKPYETWEEPFMFSELHNLNMRLVIM